MFNPLFHGSLNPEHFYDKLFYFAFIALPKLFSKDLASSLLKIVSWEIAQWLKRDMPDFRTIISQFNPCHNLTLVAAYWPFSLVDLFPPHWLISLTQSHILKTLFFMPLLSDVSAIYSAIFVYFCQYTFHLILNNIFI